MERSRPGEGRGRVFARRTLTRGEAKQSPETGQPAEFPACLSHGHGNPESTGTAATGAQTRRAPHKAGLGIRDYAIARLGQGTRTRPGFRVPVRVSLGRVPGQAPPGSRC